MFKNKANSKAFIFSGNDSIESSTLNQNQKKYVKKYCYDKLCKLKVYALNDFHYILSRILKLVEKDDDATNKRDAQLQMSPTLFCTSACDCDIS
ncbi:CLUMA_CG005779, isoform A [Clunio marinus]|uniref:CLUMA_CG005779, isoform A n=1 Tax=Clunio marinus TaxID=568069 RepID=A0A1J1HW41_9DIPT|nr:CLUMA_CG005779, isoform A [Clunio marinus]